MQLNTQEDYFSAPQGLCFAPIPGYLPYNLPPPSQYQPLPHQNRDQHPFLAQEVPFRELHPYHALGVAYDHGSPLVEEHHEDEHQDEAKDEGEADADAEEDEDEDGDEE